MFIDRKQLAEIIAQEVRARLGRLIEEAREDSDDDPSANRKPKKPSTADANDSPSPRGNGPVGPSVDATGEDDEGEGTNDRDDSDDDMDDDPGIDADGDAGEEPSGAVNNDLAGKIVQAVTIEPQSKVLPGAKEVVVSFNDTTDSLRILVTATGQVKFFWRGQLHDIP